MTAGDVRREEGRALREALLSQPRAASAAETFARALEAKYGAPEHGRAHNQTGGRDD